MACRSEAEMESLTSQDPRVAGEYRLLARLGDGGMGRVFLGLSPGGRAVAVKIVRPELGGDSSFLRRFRREVAAAQAVNGLFAAPVVGAGPDDHPPWLATAFVPGPTLANAVLAAGPFPPATVWKLAAGLIEALQAVHAAGLVHADLKPANVLLAADGPRVIDFGISRALDGTPLTAAGHVVGTPGFMSPEQATGQPADQASDVFSLGCVLAFAATGTVLFGAGSTAAALYRVVHTEPAIDAIPPPLRDLIAVCLAKDPARRPTMPHLAAATAAAGLDGGSPASFWPRPITQLIRDYQARLDGRLPQWAAGVSLAGTEPDTGPAPGVRPGRGRSAGHRPARRRPAGISRRQAVTGLGAVTAAGLGITAWKLGYVGRAAHPVVGHPAAKQPAKPSVTGTRAPSRSPGQMIWRARTAGDVTWLAVGSGAVYVTAGSAYVYALDARVGRELWRYAVSGQLNSLAVRDSVVFFAADGSVYALSAETGHQLWRSVVGAIPVLLAVTGGVAYATSNFDPVGLIGLSAATGTRIMTHGGSPRALAVTGDTAYVTEAVGDAYALALATGRRLWSLTVPGLPDSDAAPAVAEGICYVPSNGGLFALNAGTGRLLWKRAVGGVCNVVAADGIAFVTVAPAPGSADSRGGIIAMNGATGQELWVRASSSALGGVPVLVGNVLYTGGFDENVYALQATTGNELWTYATVGSVGSAIAAADGVVYAGSANGYVYALST